MKNVLLTLVICLGVANAQQKKIQWDEVQGSTDKKLLLRAASSKDERVRWAVVENPYTPPEALIALASDKSEHIRMELASRPGSTTPIEAQQILVKDASTKVIVRLAEEATFEPVQSEILDQAIRLLETPPDSEGRVQALTLIHKLCLNSHATIPVLRRVSRLPLAEFSAMAKRRMEARGVVDAQ